MDDLRERAIRGGVVSLFGQVANLLFRLGYIVVMARLLEPSDYGLVAMVTAVTSFYDLFTSGGLSTATIQRVEITHEQISTLFWVNVAIGVGLALLCVASAPVLSAFYHEPRLFWITLVISIGFLLGASTTQHSALLQRKLRYATLTSIDVLFQFANITAGISLAWFGFGYWALVLAPLMALTVNAVCLWFAAGWVPGLPQRGTGVKVMLEFGGIITLNRLVAYIAYNVDKVLLGRFWGADALGLYNRAYQLLNIPTTGINAAIGSVAFAALSRLQNDPERLKRYFLRGYSLALSMTIPTTIFCTAFADDIVLIVLGSKWMDVSLIFRFLAPTILIFGIINPTWWLLVATGRQKRSLHIALVIAPLTITAYAIGLPYGPNGVALAFSAAMTVWLVPHIVWCLHGTVVSPRDLAATAAGPFLSGVAASISALGVRYFLRDLVPPVVGLGIGGAVMVSIYFGVLLFVMGQKDFYMDVLRGLGWPFVAPAAREE